MMRRSLPSKLQVLRAREGLTLSDAAEKLGIHRVTLAQIERGLRQPMMPTLAKIAEGYGVPVEDLLDDAPLPGGEPPTLTRAQFTNHYVDVTEEEVNVANQLLEAYAIARSTGEQQKFLKPPSVDIAQVHQLIEYAMAHNLFTPEQMALLADGLHVQTRKAPA